MTTGGTIRRGDQLALLAFAVPVQALYMLFPMLIECDAAMFLNYGRFFTTGSGLYPIRPPGFPLFLALTALPFDSLMPVMVLHAAMGVAMPILIYRILAPFHRPIAVVAAMANIASTLPFVSAKMLLADQLFVFLLVASMYSLSRLYWTQQSRHVYGAVLLAFAAWLTRWEGMFFVAAVATMVFWFHPTRLRLRPLAKALGVGVAVALTWSVVRAAELKDYSLVGSVSNGTGLQLMHRAYLDIPHLLLDWETLVLRRRSPSDTTDLIRPSGTADLGIRIIDPANGPSSARLRALIEQETREHPDRLLALRSGMDSAYQGPDSQRVDVYRELVGRFEGDPVGFSGNFFAQPSNFILDFMWHRLQERFGLAYVDALYRNVAVEGLLRHPLALQVSAADVLTFFGLNLRNIVLNDGSSRLLGRMRSSYAETPFNIASCAKDALSQGMWAEYQRDWKLTDIAVVGRLMEWGDFHGRNVVQLGLGLLALGTWWVLPFSSHRRFFLLLPCVALVMMGTTAIAVGGAWGSRYEGATHPFVLVSVAGALITIQAWLSTGARLLFRRLGGTDRLAKRPWGTPE